MFLWFHIQVWTSGSLYEPFQGQVHLNKMVSPRLCKREQHTSLPNAYDVISDGETKRD
jgi:hypothetical protein